MKYFQMLNEVGLVLGDKAYPKFGNVLIMAGGAGSGKGTILNNLILFDGKIMDVDQLKTTILNTRKAQDNFDKSKDFNKYDVSQPGSSKNRLLSVCNYSEPHCKILLNRT